MKHLLILLWVVVILSVTSLLDAEKMAYVINGLGETLSKINLETGEVSNDILALGISPNHIVIRDNSAYVVNSLSHTLQIIDIEKDSTVKTIELNSGNPMRMAFLNDNTIYTTNFDSASVYEINLNTYSIVDTIKVGLSPTGILCVDNRLYVTNTGYDPVGWTYGQGTVYVIDTESNSVTDSIMVGKNPQAIALDSDGELNVVCTGDWVSIFGTVCFIDTLTNSVRDSINIGGNPGNIVIKSNGIAYLAAGGWIDSGFVYSYSTITDSILHGSANPIYAGLGVMGVTVDDEGYLYTCDFYNSSITMFDSTDSIVNTYIVGDGPIDLAIYESQAGIEETFYKSKEKVEWIGYISPNPFKNMIEIELNTELLLSNEKRYISLRIYDLSGRFIKSLTPYPNSLTYTWDGTDRSGGKVRSGVYLYMIETEDGVKTGKVIFIR
ncbi:T9SS type A sorting domain-containing protein [candidate division WOR-3 bacterium]|nr:T9SS type A sorting domain-containing protein [candidate division WOR-3 bacterium]